MGAEATKTETAWAFLPLLFSLFVLGGCSGTLMPYESSFQCPGGYNGICESIDDAYQDSVNGIDPRQFDKEWQEKKADWAEGHEELVKARKQTGKTAGASHSVQSDSYRESYLRKMQNLIDAPETPVLVPPKVIRILVLPRTYEHNRSLVGSHYLFSQLEDGARWILRKVPEVSEPCSQPETERFTDTDKAHGNIPEQQDKRIQNSRPEKVKEEKEKSANAGLQKASFENNRKSGSTTDAANQGETQGCPASFGTDEDDGELEWMP